MSADQRAPSSTLPADERTRSTRSITLVESTARDDRPPARPAVRSEAQVLPLAYRIERTRLQIRIAALERAVATSEHRRQAVIDQYERLLADRSEASETDTQPDSQSLLARLSDY